MLLQQFAFGIGKLVVEVEFEFDKPEVPLSWWSGRLAALKHRHAIIIQVIPVQEIRKFLFTQLDVHEMLPLRRSNPTMNLTRSFLFEEARHFPIDEAHNSVMIDYTV